MARMTGLKQKVAVVLTALAVAPLAGCETPVRAPDFPQLTYAHLTPFRLAVGRVEVVVEYTSPAREPNVEHLFPVHPAAAAERWAHDRLRAAGPTLGVGVGGGGLVRATVVNAAVVEVPLKRTTGLEGAFTIDQSERYDGLIEVRIDLTAADGRHRASVTSRAERSRTVPEDISLQDREKVWFEMTEAMLNDLNASLDRQIRKTFAPYLR